eukprot:CAMPEP_0171076946 /NCGR_PEP_ID=MMETSP0766_2-20121228/13733_1 /TAXON_ID=439317 /ORGANISM="Gambierdiscus australes, Strain CAWD 149" /LENGTH=349 /DNA_ID=CAMNT_0011533967 /DNA_START=20 /DNA_END=1070 /DNA_ORIENTATION=+
MDSSVREAGPSTSETYENHIFRSQTGQRIQLQHVRPSKEDRHLEARIVLLEGGELETRAGDVLQAREHYIVHCCNCHSQNDATGLAASIFEKHPEANVYLHRQRGAPDDVPGDVSVHGRVVNLYTQLQAGPPRLDYRHRGCNHDTAEDRLSWFRQCLRALPWRLPAESSHGGRLSLALPAGLGCCGVKESWPLYLAELRAFAHANPQLRLVLYSTDAGEGETVERRLEDQICSLEAAKRALQQEVVNLKRDKCNLQQEAATLAEGKCGLQQEVAALATENHGLREEIVSLRRAAGRARLERQAFAQREDLDASERMARVHALWCSWVCTSGQKKTVQLLPVVTASSALL